MKVKKQIFEAYIGSRKSKRDRPGRALEYGYPIQFDILAGFAEYRDLQRHRMLTQQRQDLGVELGYSVPEEITEIGMAEKVQECFERTESLHRDLKRAGFSSGSTICHLIQSFHPMEYGDESPRVEPFCRVTYAKSRASKVQANHTNDGETLSESPPRDGARTKICRL